MQPDHRPFFMALRWLAPLLAAGLLVASSPARTQAQMGPVVEVLDGDGAPRTPTRYDARQARRQPDLLTLRRRAQRPQTTVIVVPEPQLTPPMSTPPPVDREARRQERRRGNAYLAFGAQTGIFLGLGGGLALSLAGDQERMGATVGSLAAPILGAALAGLLRRWARSDHWREGPGQAMTGIYPGAIQGALFAGSIMHAFDLEGQERKRTLGLAIGATTLLSMVLHGNAAEAAPKRAALYYAAVTVAALVLLPFAQAYDRPEAILYGTTAAGAVHLILTGMAPTLRW